MRDSVIVMGLLCILTAGELAAGEGVADHDPGLAQAESMLVAFYAWDAIALAAAVESSADADRLLYYQGGQRLLITGSPASTPQITG